MTTLLEFVEAVTRGDVVEPFWLIEEATPEGEMNGRYREVLGFFGKHATVQMRAKLGLEPCRESDCGGVVRAVESRVPGAFRVDACCTTCGGSEVHRAGWLDREARDGHRREMDSKEVG